MKTTRLSALLLLLCVACALPVSAPAPAEPPAVLPVLRAPASEVARGVVLEVNRVRRAEGLGALEAAALYNRAAQDHAEELAQRRTLDHSSLDASRQTLTMRIEAAGGPWVMAAENLALIPFAESAVAAQTARLWLNSSGHRTNMLDSAYTHTGVGVAADGDGGWYVVQLYVLPRRR